VNISSYTEIGVPSIVVVVVVASNDKVGRLEAYGDVGYKTS